MIAELVDVEQRTFADMEALTQIDAAIWRHLVRAGVLQGVVGQGEHGTCDVEEARAIAAELDAARKSVDGQGIRIRAAAAKYGFSNPSIYKWRDDGWVNVIGTTNDGDQLVNEGDIAFARKLADLVGHVPGRSVFPAKPRSGRPKKPR